MFLNYKKKKVKKFNKFLFNKKYFNFLLTYYPYLSKFQKTKPTFLVKLPQSNQKIISKSFIQNSLLQKNVNYFIKQGKKTIAYNHLVYLFELLYKTNKKNPYFFLFKALDNIAPCASLVSIRNGRNIKQKPIVLPPILQYFKGLKLLLFFDKKHKQKNWLQNILKYILETIDKRGALVLHQKKLMQTILLNRMYLYLK